MDMRKAIVLLAALLLTAFSTLPTQAENTPSTALVVVFSHAGENWQVGVIEEGNTMKMAKIIAEQLNADLLEIVPEVPYPVDYAAVKDAAQEELDQDARPAYVGDVEHWNEYETVLIGYPIWWGGMPKIVEHFLEKHDFSGKTVIPFNTHGGSGQGGTQAVIERMLPEATVLQGLAITGTQAQNHAEKTRSDVTNWLTRLGLIQ